MDKVRIKSISITPDTTIKQAMQKLEETAAKILFVIDEENRLIGTVTDGDIRRGIIHGEQFSGLIGEIMNKAFISVKSDTPDIKEVVKQLMIEAVVEQIPAIDSRGIITDVFLWTDVLEKEKEPGPQKLNSNYVVVIAGGKGTRLDPFTKILPKPLIPIGSKPVIELIMERFYLHGFHQFIYTLNYKKEYLKLFLRENNFPYTIDWVEEDSYLGTAGSLSLLKDKITDTFFVVNCDSLIHVNFEEVLRWHKEQKASITVIGCHNEVKIPFGVLQLNNGRLEKILEKPTHDVIINTGVYVMEPHVISNIPLNDHFDMNQLIDMVARKEKVTAYPIHEGWFDIGQWEEYKKSVEKLGSLDNV